MQDAWSFIWNGIVTTFEKTVLELQKAWIRTKGLFDSEEEVNAEIAVVEGEYNNRKAAREQKSADAVNQREAERKALGEEWDSKNAAIDTAMNNEIMENQQAYRDALGGAAAEIEAAKSQWQSAMDEVKKRAEAKAAEHTEAEEKPEGLAEIAIDDFAKVELRCAEVVSCEPIPKAKKLLKLQLDLGYEKRQVASGIAKFYKPEELIGKKVVLVANLKPAVLCGVESCGMILASSDKEGTVRVIFLDPETPNGAEIH